MSRSEPRRCWPARGDGSPGCVGEHGDRAVYPGWSPGVPWGSQGGSPGYTRDHTGYTALVPRLTAAPPVRRLPVPASSAWDQICGASSIIRQSHTGHAQARVLCAPMRPRHSSLRTGRAVPSFLPHLRTRRRSPMETQHAASGVLRYQWVTPQTSAC